MSKRNHHPQRQPRRQRVAVHAGVLSLGLLLGGGLMPVAAVAAPSAVRVQAAAGLAEVPAAVAQGRATRLGALTPDRQLSLALTLQLRDEAGLDAFNATVENPTSPNFRHYLSVQQFADQFGPTVADHAAVRRYFAAQGFSLDAPAANRLVVDLRGRVADIERVFQVPLAEYRDAETGRVYYAPDRAPQLPANLAIAWVSGLDNAELPQPHRHTPAAHPQATTPTGSAPGGDYWGSDIRAAYYGSGPLDGAGQSVGLLELGGYDVTDVQRYFDKAGQPLNVPVVGVSVNGASVECGRPCADAEQVLDIEEAISMAPGMDSVRVYVGNSPVSILNRMASDNLSAQLSSSWGWHPNADAVEPIFKEYIAQGQSFLDATGDYGDQLRRGVVWPGDDAYVTGVGGTTLETAGAGGAWLNEEGWQYSAGGVTPDHIALPDYQRPFVNASNGGSTRLRNVPDIAGVAADFYSCFGGVCIGGNGGTSYAAPLWAGFIALVNQQAAAQSQPRVGFLNPTLYALAGGSSYLSLFHDQTVGSNGRTYTAVPGYDLVTGLGSPTGQALIDALIAGQ